MNEGMFELLSERVHDSWVEEKMKDGYHHPSKCPTKKSTGVFDCLKCHPDILPYGMLPDNVKELDRIKVREFEKSLKAVGGYITFPASLRYITKRASDDLKEFRKFILENLKAGHDLVSLFWTWFEERRIGGLELYCPHCGWDKKTGYTLYEGRIEHACDPGCCCTLMCCKCGRVYGLVENKVYHWDVKKKALIGRGVEKYFKKKLSGYRRGGKNGKK
jgi:hypothetical protein